MQTIAMLNCVQTNYSNLFKNGITNKLFTYKQYVYPFKCVQTNDWCWIELLMLKSYTLNYLSANKCALARLKMLPTDYLFANYTYLIYMYKQDLALNNLQELICHKTSLTNHLVIHLNTNQACCYLNLDDLAGTGTFSVSQLLYIFPYS